MWSGQIIANRQNLAGRLAEPSATYLPGAAHFRTIRLPQPAAEAVAAHARANIAVQALGWPDAMGSIRITIGTRADSDRLLAVLRSVLAG